MSQRAGGVTPRLCYRGVHTPRSPLIRTQPRSS
jgi:hypothetical protein